MWNRVPNHILELDGFGFKLSQKNKELAIYGEQDLVLCTKTNSQYIPIVILVGTQKEPTLPFLNSRYQNQETLF